MKNLILLPIFSLIGKLAFPQYKPVDLKSFVIFRIKNFGFEVSGSFNGLSGNILFDPQNPAEAAFDVSVNSNSVNTDNEMRDDHLRKSGFFDAEKYPHIRLISDKVAPAAKKGVFLFTGKLTLKNHTKDISFPFTAEPVDGGFRFKGTFSINRKDFEVGGTSTISDKLDVILDITAKKER
jgi:polyisoprenoid-binding protein YceI